ncbi:response regulator transcription factor LytR [Bowmanella denitrificans]|uniref:Response regulator transcription factor LytR n=1 Tax=Bowmanella denitrificans TaxID=366582 RepID=A0ABP3H9Q8_9ALTE|nr:LytTR family DNA-binding domain-containing protein [Bowmanella denitrificans]
MKLLIVEDEPMVAKRLLRFVEQALANQPRQIRLFDNLDDARDHLAERGTDILFLDLNLSGQDGFELLREQLAQSFHTIVVSANTDRAIEAFELGVLDFIPKPFSQERIVKALTRLTQSQAMQPCKYLSYRQAGNLALLDVKNIVYLKACGHYTEVYPSSGPTILHDKSLERLEHLLPQEFQRIHRSYMVPLSQCKTLQAFVGSSYELELKNGVRLPVGRTRVKALRAKLI